MGNISSVIEGSRQEEPLPSAQHTISGQNSGHPPAGKAGLTVSLAAVRTTPSITMLSICALRCESSANHKDPSRGAGLLPQLGGSTRYGSSVGQGAFASHNWKSLHSLSLGNSQAAQLDSQQVLGTMRFMQGYVVGGAVAPIFCSSRSRAE